MKMSQIYGLLGGFFLAYLVVHVASPPKLSSRDPKPSNPEAQPAQNSGTAAVATGLSVVVPTTQSDAYALEIALEKLQRAGARHVSLVVAFAQSDASSADITTLTPIPVVQRGLARARALGLAVMVRPVIAPRDGAWRNRIAPAKPVEWFTQYQTALIPLWDVAQQEGAASVAVAVGLPQMDEADWSLVIQTAKQHFKGRLLYGASGVAGVKRFRHWRELSGVGVENVFRLSAEATIDPAAIAAGWRNVADELEQTLTEQGLEPDVTVTSVGFAALQGALVDPEHPPLDASPAPLLPQQAIAGFYEQWGARPWLKQVYWHTWWTPSGRSPYLLDGQPAFNVFQTHWQ